MTNYREADLVKWAPAIADAWLLVNKDAKDGRDEGTCVLGAGIAAWVIPKRGRYSRCRILIAAPFQGNIGSQRACARALASLRAAGLDVFWHDGRLD